MLLGIALIAFELFLLVLFIRMAFDINAIRSMLENQGLFSGVGCPRCRMPIPDGAEVCGHCGTDLAPATSDQRRD